MDNTLDIIEIIDGKHNLNTEKLQSALALAEGCDSIALISIVGPKNSGKSFLIKCLLSYMNSKSKDEWPEREDRDIEMDYKAQDKDYDMKPVIKLTKNPYIITEDEERTAVFLIDTNFVFDSEMSSKQELDILELLLLTSSTVIYNSKRFLPIQEFTRLENITSKLSNIESSMNSMKNIMFLIRDWNPNERKSKFNFGLYEGSKYIEDFIKHLQLNKKHEDFNLNCCLMSAPNPDQRLEDISLSELSPQFLKDMKTLIGCKLLNFDEMELKRKFNSRKVMNSQELFKLFEDCVQILNDSLSDENLNLKTYDRIRCKKEIIKSTSNAESNNTKSIINHKNDEPLESHENQLSYKQIKNNKIERNEEQNKIRDFYSFDNTLAQNVSDTSIVFIENHKNLNEDNNEDIHPKADLIDLVVDFDDDIVLCSASSGSGDESSNDYEDDYSFTLLMNEMEDGFIDSISLKNESYDKTKNLSQQSLDITKAE